MLDILFQRYNTGAENAVQTYPDDGKKSQGIAEKFLEITLGAQIDNEANADIYKPVNCKLLGFLPVYPIPANATFSINGGNIRVTAGADIPSGTAFKFLILESAV